MRWFFQHKFKFSPFGHNGLSKNFKLLLPSFVNSTKAKSQAVYMTIGLGMFFSVYLLNNRVKCIEKNQTKSTQSSQ